MAPYVNFVTFRFGRLAAMAALFSGLAACEVTGSNAEAGTDAATGTDVSTPTPDAAPDADAGSDVAMPDVVAPMDADGDATSDAETDASKPTPDATSDSISDAISDAAPPSDTTQDTAADTATADGADEDVVELPPDECAADEDCAADAENLCLTPTCGVAQDGHKVCLQEPVVCEPTDICLAAECDAKLGCTESFETSADCCFQEIHATYDFEGTDASEVSVTNQAVDGTPEATWSLTNIRSYTGDTAYYFGIPEVMNYDKGTRVAADLDFPATLVSADGRDELVFHIWLDVEEGDSWDVLILSAVKADGTSTPIWVKTYDNVVMLSLIHI